MNPMEDKPAGSPIDRKPGGQFDDTAAGPGAGLGSPQTAGAASPRRSFPNHAESIAAILDVIRQGERFLVCSHSRPDGDAVGSMLATGMLLQQMGKRADLVTADRIPNIYRELPGAEGIRCAMRVHGPYDAV